jgi:phage terminase small subunit
MTDESISQVDQHFTRRQRLFVEHYLQCWNASEAARRAGYNGASDVVGPRLLGNVGIKALIEKRFNEIAMSTNEVMMRLTDIARGDIADLMGVGTSGFTIELMTEDEQGNKIVNPKTKLIRRVRQKVTTFLGKKKDDEDREIIETELELYSAHDALRDIGKIRGMFVDKTDITSGGKPLKTMEVVPIDYRSAIASLAPGPVEDSPTSSEGENPIDGETVG